MVKRVWEERMEEAIKEGKIGIMNDDSPLACPYCKGTNFILFVGKHENQYRCESCGASGPFGDEAYSAIQKMNKDLNRLFYLERERNLLFFSLPPDFDFRKVSMKEKEEFYMKWNKGTTNTAVGAIEMLESLHESVKFAGGDPEKFTVEELKNMSAMDLIAHLGCNGVRFYCSERYVLIENRKAE